MTAKIFDIDKLTLNDEQVRALNEMEQRERNRGGGERGCRQRQTCSSGFLITGSCMPTASSQRRRSMWRWNWITCVSKTSNTRTGRL